MHVELIDVIIIALYGAVVLGIGFALRGRMSNSGEFLLAGRSIPAWTAGLAFLSANLGAQEMIGMAASGAKYGIMTSHFYWVGAIPAMVFVGVFMMPFYYGSRARSVPEYLKLRFDEKTRAFNALTFAVMTVFSSGISMYAMGALLSLLLGWNIHACIIISAVVVLCYIALGGLTSAIYNEVLQFFLIVFGFAPIVYLGLREIGGWEGLRARVPETFVHSWTGMGNAANNPLGVEWFGLLMGLGFVLSFGYWCTDFLVVQRAMAADSMNAARRTPLIAAVPKMMFPFLVIVPGIIALGLTLHPQAGAAPLLPAAAGGGYDYNMALPMMMSRYYPAGLLGLGLTALLASFMSGMAGNVTAFNTVWTYDLYQSYLVSGKSDAHYLTVGRVTTVVGTLISVGTAYMAMRFNNIMDMLQLVFSFVNAPLFATFLLGMFWRRTTGHAAFWGLVSGTAAAAGHYELTGLAGGGSLLAKIALLHTYRSDMAQNFWGAIWAWTTCFAVTILISLLTRPKPVEQLKGLVYGLTPAPSEGHLPWFLKPLILGIIVLACTAALNLIFW
ncbi:MAG TPA: sodium:solute symporter family protein [Vicinamibacterales bacterium]|nr:sodium:solute symporter family protein [Vicinamibacterales bacterium]